MNTNIYIPYQNETKKQEQLIYKNYPMQKTPPQSPKQHDNINLYISKNEYTIDEYLKLSPYNQMIYYINKYNINTDYIKKYQISDSYTGYTYLHDLSQHITFYQKFFQLVFRHLFENKKTIDISNFNIKFLKILKSKNGQYLYQLFNILNEQIYGILKQFLNPINENLKYDDLLSVCDLCQDLIIGIFKILDNIYFYGVSFNQGKGNSYKDIQKVFEKILLDENICSIKPIQRTNKIHIPIKTQNWIWEQQYIEVEVPLYDSYTFQLNDELVKNIIQQYYTTNHFSYNLENYQPFQQVRSYDKYRLLLLFENLVYLPDCSEEYVKTFEFYQLCDSNQLNSRKVILKKTNHQHHTSYNSLQDDCCVKMNHVQHPFNIINHDNIKCGKCQKPTTINDSFIYGCCNKHICSECVKKQIFPECMYRYPDHSIYNCPCCNDDNPFKTIYI